MQGCQQSGESRWKLILFQGQEKVKQFDLRVKKNQLSKKVEWKSGNFEMGMLAIVAVV